MRRPTHTSSPNSEVDGTILIVMDEPTRLTYNGPYDGVGAVGLGHGAVAARVRSPPYGPRCLS